MLFYLNHHFLWDKSNKKYVPYIIKHTHTHTLQDRHIWQMIIIDQNPIKNFFVRVRSRKRCARRYIGSIGCNRNSIMVVFRSPKNNFSTTRTRLVRSRQSCRFSITNWCLALLHINGSYSSSIQIIIIIWKLVTLQTHCEQKENRFISIRLSQSQWIKDLI